jgi:SPP1 family phage portal protein
MAGRIDWLSVLRDAIHEFGMAVDIKKADFGAAPSGVALKFQYTLLDLKANALITQMKAALEQHFWFITQTLNSASGLAFDPASIDISFSKSAIMNDLETIGMINLSVDTVPERMLLAHHPFVDDPDAALKEMEKQRKKKAEEARKAFGSYGLPDETDPDNKDDDK